MNISSKFLESSPIACSALVEAHGHKYYVTLDRITGDIAIHGLERTVTPTSSVFGDYPLDYTDEEMVEAAAATAVLQMFAAQQ